MPPVADSSRRTSWRRALLIGVAADCCYAAVVLAWSLFPGSNVSVTGSLLWAATFTLLAGLGTVAVPVVLRLRYGLRSPLALLAVILLFWHVLVYVPPIGPGRGDSPGFLFVLVLAPFYVVAYLLIGGVERALGKRSLTRVRK